MRVKGKLMKFRVSRLVSCALAVASTATSPALGGESRFEGELVAGDQGGLTLDMVRAEWASYGGRPMPVLWNGGCESGALFSSRPNRRGARL
jgi:hypothetical protein